MEYIEKSLPLRDVTFWNVRESGMRVYMDIAYTIETESRTTTYTQPVSFPLCEMKFLGSQFHENVMASLSKQWHQTSKQMSAK